MTRRTNNASTISRREFLKGSAVAAGAAIAWPTIVPSSVLGTAAPSNRITLGCIGVGGKGTGNMKAFQGNPGVEVVAVCDVEAGHCEKARQTASLDAKSCHLDHPLTRCPSLVACYESHPQCPNLYWLSLHYVAQPRHQYQHRHRLHSHRHGDNSLHHFTGYRSDHPTDATRHLMTRLPPHHLNAHD